MQKKDTQRRDTKIGALQIKNTQRRDARFVRIPFAVSTKIACYFCGNTRILFVARKKKDSFRRDAYSLRKNTCFRSKKEYVFFGDTLSIPFFGIRVPPKKYLFQQRDTFLPHTPYSEGVRGTGYQLLVRSKYLLLLRVRKKKGHGISSKKREINCFVSLVPSKGDLFQQRDSFCCA